MSKASEIAKNVWLGPTPDSLLCLPSTNDPLFDIFIETNDLAQCPDLHTLDGIGESSSSTPQHLEFPSSGSILPQAQTKLGSHPLIIICQWIHNLAHPRPTSDHEDENEYSDSDGDIQMKRLNPRARKILIHCTDGYTESTLLALAYFMYAKQISAPEAWLRLHCEKKRNFFAYPSDVATLVSLQHHIITCLPLTSKIQSPDIEQPGWFTRIDGSLPSRLLPYMYLGNLGHANNPELLKSMGVKRILSVGEPANWSRDQVEDWGERNLLFIDRVQDNGVDPLMKDFERCLDFIGQPAR